MPMRAALIALTIALAGCCETAYVTRPLPLPARPVLPAVTETDITCLTDDTYRRLAERERLRREYCEELEVIIRDTQEKQ